MFTTYRERHREPFSMGVKQSENESMSFEEAFSSLEGIVDEIESNPLELEELVKRYERGMQLLKHCRGILEDTKKRLIVLNQVESGKSTESTPSTQTSTDESDDFSEFRLS